MTEDDDLQALAASLMSAAETSQAERLPSLDAARSHPQGTVILRSTASHDPYVVCDGPMVRCNEDQLWQLLSDLEHVVWSDSGDELPPLSAGERLKNGGPSGGARLTFAALRFDAGDGNGQQGLAAGGMWVHPDFQSRGLSDAIVAVLRGKQDRLGLSEVPPAPEEAEVSW